MIFSLIYNIFYFLIIISAILYINRLINGEDIDISIKSIKNNENNTIETFNNGNITKTKINDDENNDDDDDNDNNDDSDDSDDENDYKNKNLNHEKLENAKNEIEKFKAGFDIKSSIDLDLNDWSLPSYGNSTSKSSSINSVNGNDKIDIDNITLNNINKKDFIKIIDYSISNNKRLELGEKVLQFISTNVDLITPYINTINTNAKSYEKVQFIITTYDTLKTQYGIDNKNILEKNDEITKLISDSKILNTNVHGYMQFINNLMSNANISINDLIKITDEQYKNKLIDLFDKASNIQKYITNADNDALTLKANVEKLEEILEKLSEKFKPLIQEPVQQQVQQQQVQQQPVQQQSTQPIQQQVQQQVQQQQVQQQQVQQQQVQQQPIQQSQVQQQQPVQQQPVQQPVQVPQQSQVQQQVQQPVQVQQVQQPQVSQQLKSSETFLNYHENFTDNLNPINILSNVKQQLSNLETQLNNTKVETFLNSNKKNTQKNDYHPYDSLIFGSSLSSFGLIL
jgi:hypothetical protein